MRKRKRVKERKLLKLDRQRGQVVRGWRGESDVGNEKKKLRKTIRRERERESRINGDNDIGI